MKLYISEGAVWLLVIFFVPLVLWLLWKLWRALPRNLIIRVSVTAVVLLIVIAVPLWDVMITSAQMAKLCPQAGNHIKRTEKVEGYFSTIGTPDVLDRGFKYVEGISGGRVTVYTKSGNAVQKLEFDVKDYQPKSHYEFITDHGRAFTGYLNIGITRSVVRNRQTGEEIAYALKYRAYPGWVDRNTMALLGKIFWSCPEDSFQDIRLVRQTLLPAN